MWKLERGDLQSLFYLSLITRNDTSVRYNGIRSASDGRIPESTRDYRYYEEWKKKFLKPMNGVEYNESTKEWRQKQKKNKKKESWGGYAFVEICKQEFITCRFYPKAFK